MDELSTDSTNPAGNISKDPGFIRELLARWCPCPPSDDIEALAISTVPLRLDDTSLAPDDVLLDDD